VAALKQQTKIRRRGRSRTIPPEARPRRRRWRTIGLLIIAAAAVSAFWPKPQSWHSLGPHTGRIRWAGTRTDELGEHPLAPAWIRALRKAGIPWPTDLPLEPLGPSFGPGTAAWYLVQSTRPSDELWSVDKETVRILDAKGAESPWGMGTGSALVDGDRRLQFVYLGVPQELSRKGASLKFRLRRVTGPGQMDTSQEVVVPF
jgi:hypothetical protein